jgi:plasmid stabilization system protein ParE
VTRHVRFHPLATAEVVEAQLWYGYRVDGLGVRFLDAVRATTERAARWPNAGTPTRQDDSGNPLETTIALAGFPYVVVYRVANEDLEVLARSSRTPSPVLLGRSRHRVTQT